ncbi:MAG TPA: chemotaxis protein CheA [Desulfonatronum sp.]|nr:chemotaxis protein CheA [Desulfonatronum sp.]
MSFADQGRKAYLVEASEILDQAEETLLKLEKKPEDSELLNRFFRSMHTIKGSGAMFGFDEIALFTHEVETFMDKVREGAIRLNTELVDLLFQSRDLIRDMLKEEGTNRGERARDIVSALQKHLPRDEITQESSGPAIQADAVMETEPLRIFRIKFRPGENIFFTGANPFGLLQELLEMAAGRKPGDQDDTGPVLCRIVARTDHLPALQDLNPELCCTWWDIILTTARDENAIRDVFIFVEDDAELVVETLSESEQIGTERTQKKLGEILVHRGVLTPQDIEEVLQQQEKIGQLLVRTGKVSSQEVASALAEQELSGQVSSLEKAKTKVQSSIRVDSEKLDKLVDLVGELVIAQSRLNQVAGHLDSSELIALAEEMERLSDSLRDNTMTMRMLPIGITFNKFSRLVRDLSRELGKEIRLTAEGGETELDKTVIERLNDPLVHLLRNSIDHGIEDPEARIAAGKPREGNIVLTAAHGSGEVIIRIKDDGKGLDSKKIREKAVSKGIVSPDAEMTEQQLHELIFAPGFSTATKVTGVSGRGVGMDVVKRGIDELRGGISLESKKGRGTAITMKLPLTLAIIDGLQVDVGAESFIIPLSNVEECIELRHTGEKREAKSIVNLRGEVVPYVRLVDWFGLKEQGLAIEQIVIMNISKHRVGLVVDKVVGQHQTVIKSLGRVYGNVRGVSGATVNGDGSMSLILDVSALVEDSAKDA